MASGVVGSSTGSLDQMQLSDEEIRAVVDEATRAGTYVMAHVYAAQGIHRLVELGVRTIEHGNLLDEDTARLMASRDTYLVPNLVAYQSIARHGAKQGYPPAALARLRLSWTLVHIRSSWPEPLALRSPSKPTWWEQTCAIVGYPKTIRVDQGLEFISRDRGLWAYTKGVTLDLSRPGKPTDNAFIEAFNGRFPGGVFECALVPDACRRTGKLEAWRRYYNEVRPHGTIGNEVPIWLQISRGVSSPLP